MMLLLIPSQLTVDHEEGNSIHARLRLSKQNIAQIQQTLWGYKRSLLKRQGSRR
jgi:hypothetical protein